VDATGDFPQVVDHAHELRSDAGDLGTELGMSGIWLTAANSTSGGSPRATSLASRRSDACLPASSRSFSSASALAVVIPASSMNSAIRDSVSAGKSSREVATVAPVASPGHDGHSHGGPQAQPAHDRTERSVRQALTVDPRRATGPQGGRHHHPGGQLHPGSRPAPHP
jgi:hypothetical protein